MDAAGRCDPGQDLLCTRRCSLLLRKSLPLVHIGLHYCSAGRRLKDDRQLAAVPGTRVDDPIDKQAFDDQIAGLVGAQMDSQQYKTGFLPNTKRGTGKCWSETATKNFLSVNKLKCVIRAHEVAPKGFMHHHDGLVTTVFSCPTTRTAMTPVQSSCRILISDRSD